jgi:hypothetical protein
MLLNPLGFICYNEIRDYIRGKGGEDGEVNREVKVKERGGNNDKRGDVKSGDMGDCNSKGIVDFRIIALISSLLLSSLSILNRQLVKSLGQLSLI